jgi:hypothetical protein
VVTWRTQPQEEVGVWLSVSCVFCCQNSGRGESNCGHLPKSLHLSCFEDSCVIRGCIQKFPDWPPRAKTANGTVPFHQVQLYRYFVSQCGEFCRHNPLCCFSTSVYCCKRIFRYRFSPETFRYTIVTHENEAVGSRCWYSTPPLPPLPSWNVATSTVGNNRHIVFIVKSFPIRSVSRLNRDQEVPCLNTDRRPPMRPGCFLILLSTSRHMLVQCRIRQILFDSPLNLPTFLCFRFFVPRYFILFLLLSVRTVSSHISAVL